MSFYLKWTAKGRIPSYRGGPAVPYRKWTDRVKHPVLCERGWHACRWEDAVHHIDAELWVCDLDGVIVAGDDKVVAERLRIVRKVKGINERSLRLFAADHAEQVLPIFEQERPADDRPRKAIAAARAYAEGRITHAARDAASAAAMAAARDAASAAAWATAYAAASAAAWAAARAAASAATMAAARAAASVAGWQTDRLLCHYAGLDPDDFVHS